MSRIGRMPINVPKEVTVSCEASKVEVAGPKGRLSHLLPEGITASVEGGKILVQRPNDQRTSRSLQGLTRSLIANMVTGVTKGFERKLEIVGVGFKAEMEQKAIKLTVGFSHSISFPLPEGIQADIDKQTLITLKGIDRQLVGAIAAKLRSIKPPEPYKGKGIRYSGEHIRKKVGKTKA